MSRVYVAVEIELASDKRTIHEILIPDLNERGGYHQIGSLNSFTSGRRRGLTDRERQVYRVTPAWAPGRLYHLQLAEEWERDAQFTLQSLRRHGVEVPDETKLPRTRHENLWAFYAHIGWDRKKRRYVDAQGRPIRYSAV